MAPVDQTATALAAPLRVHVDKAAKYVVTVAGADGPTDLGRAIEMDGAEPQRVLIGQGPACALRLSDPLVSRRHIALEVTPSGLKVSDLQSTNGTTVNGVRVGEAWLTGGEMIVVGATTLRVDLVSDVAPIQIPSEQRFGRVIGGSPAMRKLYPLLARLAVTDVPVIIEGETGTGKELLAEALHEEGPRAKKPFVVFDCTAVSPNLIESALFGHEKGAFTGAAGARRGVFEQADGGTLLIDEVGDLDLPLQSKLLRAVERSEVQRVGGEKWLEVDVRVLAATRRDLDAEIQAKRFREDLFFRLNVARAELPPLRARAGDVGLLARHFWRELGDDGTALPADFLPRFESYGWPGNVRELYNTVARRRALGHLAALDDTESTRSAPGTRPLPATGAPIADDPFDQILEQNLPFPHARQAALSEFERRYVERTLRQHKGDVVKAAAASGIGRRYFNMLRARQPR
jgi:two-component system, NtrC family, response regulator HydG